MEQLTMVQEFVSLVPKDAGTVGLVIALAGSLLGAGIWLAGARYSRPIVTLLTVTLGAVVGMHLPGWLGWSISGAGPAVGAALLLGVTGYALHGMWVGVGLGTVLASWAAMACWIAFRGPQQEWTWPAVDAGTTVASFLHTVWQQLPPDVGRVLPYATATAMISGLAMAIIWPRLSLILGWSLAGVTLLAGMGVAAMEYARPEWLARIPPQTSAQAGLLGLLVAIGGLVQWRLGPKMAPAAGAKDPEADQTD